VGPCEREGGSPGRGGAAHGQRQSGRTGEGKNRGGARKGEEGADVRAPVAEGGGECGERERALGLRSRGSGPAHGPCGGEREERGPGEERRRERGNWAGSGPRGKRKGEGVLGLGGLGLGRERERERERF
jgi:hypothetical protein